MLELKHNGTLIQTIREGGWFTLPNGDHVSPAMAGWSNDEGYALSEAPEPAPVLPMLAAIKASAQAEMLAWVDNFTAIFTADTPIDERLSWDAKEAAARAWLAGTATAEQEALLRAEAEITGESTDNLALLILANADLFRAVIGRVSGLRRTTSDAINAAETPEAVQAVLDAAKAQALAMAAALGLSL
ncbi:hypothetical protein [Phaeovulum sp.]|uniref:hypothetical protein n=1 Tax=Phaeovulum sp. TaxID=2934796 RepID=UPI0027305F22|nr:hypothetical protein [Phaeovulum sp.]MDP1668602.1 hypothetical protein [Phaeovulum sp.]MDZ4119909.1 hypothetical protein [Phaeovulum sp.]